MMHELGQGISKDYKEAVKWYRLAAEQGNPHARYKLGTMYYNGQGVPQDNVSAYMWWNICASSGERLCVENRDFIEKKMSPSQIEEAQEMARIKKPEYLKGVLEKLQEIIGTDE